MTLLICPRCKQRCLDRNSYGESGIYRSRHRLCVPCWHAENDECDREGTNNLPETLKSYGPENDVAHIARALHAGANEYIMKPFDREIVRDKFDEVGLL